MAYRNIEIYAVQPKAATNLVTNPSFELATTGYTAVGASSSIARTATNGYQRRGAYGLDITPTANAESGVYFATVTLTSGTTYTFSCDVKDVAAQTFSINFVAADGSPSGTAVTWTGDGYWKRKAVSWACSSSETYRLYLTRASVNSTTHFYTDGWQCEAGAESTYFDGDMRGYIRGRTDFYWTGTPHASTSVRTAMTRQGGTLTRLRDYCSISGIMGLGMETVQNNASEVSGDGSYYQNTRAVERTLDISVDFYSQSGGYTTIAANRAAVVAAIQPDNVPLNEPMRLLVQLEDSSGNPSSDMCAIDCLYSSGLEQNLTNTAQVLERAVISFTAFDPFVKSEAQAGSTLTLSATLADSAYLVYRTAAGVWTSAGVVNGAVYCLAEDANGRIYAGGAFTSIGGVAANRVAYWDGAAWNAMDTGLAAAVYALAVGPNGYIYAGGAALAPGGATSSVAVWNGSAWAAPMGGGNDPTVTVYALKFGATGHLYIGGSFASASGDTVNGICRWDGADYYALGSGFASGTVRAIEVKSGKVYAAGDVANTGVQMWNGSAWTDLEVSFDDYVYSLAFSVYGPLYAAGVSTPGAATICAFDRWNGASWQWADPAGVSFGYASTEAVRCVRADPRGGLYFAGSILRFGVPTDMPASAEIVKLFGSSWQYLDINLTIAGGEYISDVLPTASGQLWLAGNWVETDATAASTTSITYSGARTWPVIKFTGPGVLENITNYTTGQVVTFNGLTLLAGEKATLDLRRGQISFTSTFRGNLMSYISTGSDMDWGLIAGTNVIGVTMLAGTTGDSAAVAWWSPAYHTFDTVAR